MKTEYRNTIILLWVHKIIVKSIKMLTFKYIFDPLEEEDLKKLVHHYS